MDRRMSAVFGVHIPSESRTKEDSVECLRQIPPLAAVFNVQNILDFLNRQHASHVEGIDDVMNSRTNRSGKRKIVAVACFLRPIHKIPLVCHAVKKAVLSLILPEVEEHIFRIRKH